MIEYTPPGPHCMLAIEKLEELGPMTVAQVAALVPGANNNTLSRSLLKAVIKGYVTVKLGNQHVDNCNVFKVVPNWREVHAARMALYVKQPRKDKPVIQARWAGVNSVFAMGARV